MSEAVAIDYESFAPLSFWSRLQYLGKESQYHDTGGSHHCENSVLKFLVTGATGFIGQRVVQQLLRRRIAIVATDVNIVNEGKILQYRINSAGLDSRLLDLRELDISNRKEVNQICADHKFSHMICCGYQMSNLIDSDPARAAEVNIVGMTNLFDSVARNDIRRLIFPSSESVYGESQQLYGHRAVKESDYCGLQHHRFSYAVMKLLNEFMAEKFVSTQGVSIACTRPSIVFGYGRQRSSLMWADDFVTLPALGRSARLPFPEDNKDSWIYVDDCAEQMILLALKDNLSHFVYNTGSETVTGKEFAATVRNFLPEADITFDNDAPYTPFIDTQDDTRIRSEISYTPRSIKMGILSHINEARRANGLSNLEEKAN